MENFGELRSQRENEAFFTFGCVRAFIVNFSNSPTSSKPPTGKNCSSNCSWVNAPPSPNALSPEKILSRINIRMLCDVCIYWFAYAKCTFSWLLFFIPASSSSPSISKDGKRSPGGISSLLSNPRKVSVVLDVTCIALVLGCWLTSPKQQKIVESTVSPKTSCAKIASK